MADIDAVYVPGTTILPRYHRFDFAAKRHNNRNSAPYPLYIESMPSWQYVPNAVDPELVKRWCKGRGSYELPEAAPVLTDLMLDNNVWDIETTGMYQWPERLLYTVVHRQASHQWHMDYAEHDRSKLSITVMLQQADKGGAFVTLEDDQPPYLQPGDALVFPSYLMHCVRPVTAGMRKTVVGWLAGEPWR